MFSVRHIWAQVLAPLLATAVMSLDELHNFSGARIPF